MDCALVEEELEMELLLSPVESVPVRTRLAYRAGDPYAVRIAFHVGEVDPVTWTFARDLLREGLHRAVGAGDVRLWPAAAGRELAVLLRSPSGDAFLRAPAAAVEAFLRATAGLVPPGRETDHLGLDRALEALLARP